jgi:hypothetical protein
VGSTFIPTIGTSLLVPYSGLLIWVHVTATRTILITLLDAVTHNKSDLVKEDGEMLCLKTLCMTSVVDKLLSYYFR